MKSNLLSCLNSILLFIGLEIVSVQSYWTEFEYSGIENSKTGSVITDIKVGRFNRTTITLNGHIDIGEDITGLECEVKAFFSSKGNSQYILMPYKISRDDCCKIMENSYWKAVEERLLESSDIPERKADELYCVTLKKGVYTMRDFTFDQKVIPKFVETGTYRIEIKIFRKQEKEFPSLGIFKCRLY